MTSDKLISFNVKGFTAKQHDITRIVPVLASDWVAVLETSEGNVWVSTSLASWGHGGGAVSSALGVPLHQMVVACHSFPYLFKEMDVKKSPQ